jgi:hypothetical protein
MPPRKAIPMKTKLCAALCQMMEPDEAGGWRRVIPHRDAKRMTEDEILARFEFDHNVHAAIGGTEQHWNLTPRTKETHRAKTAKKDVPMIAKAKRVEASHEEFRRKMLSKTGAETEETKKPSSKMQSRGFQAWRNFKGEIVKRGGK